MKRDKLFEECLSKVEPEVREYVRTQMDYQLMGLPTDEEIKEWYDGDISAQSSAMYMRSLAYKLLKEQRQNYIKKSCEYWTGVFDRDDYGLGVHTEKAIERFLKAMEE